MKRWLFFIVLVVLTPFARAADYRVIYSPSLELEVYIDDVASNAPSDWCQQSLTLRIVTSNQPNSQVLDNFLPRVGKLLESQCSRLTSLNWQLTNKQGMAVATGSATRTDNWQPKVIADSTAGATHRNASPLDLSQPANRAALQRFDLPDGCHFRTWWDEQGQALFIPQNKTLSCSADGWLTGPGHLTINHNGQSDLLQVVFFHGYPLAGIPLSAPATLQILAVNNQRMLLGRENDRESWLLLPFDKQQHSWVFKGTLLLKMDKQQATDAGVVKQRIARLRQQWSDSLPAESHLNIMLINAIYPDLADPAIGAWRTLTD
ncbi:hypothetical protein BL250_10845 [Erwinia sp. OLTSP20]|uniref:hypothetical protein n=1 Tax=unclassified Erwinia TaxID=2622719 RepID=UPI000C17CA7A|nr:MULTISPECIES: hypothetical protein [unclassified Erwinia]PIJ49972.1 hypothetical protein BV501_10675 [Erwinia sp. OAMSP11]PIJ71380.1 hypothetical protein BK416_11720 [Erwinia sp. OLSSP12]PIJ80615.1 hypothetical protein BLD47_10615 [Erwinia sp. OLCASP19]PIJ82789.1 hypothetical protein BLD46_10455 [Erwinia sp. OLMTSP26]PIJ85474.1 hypothetical protein BLD49_10645 [Erwinia sp. OLMDSP33]